MNHTLPQLPGHNLLTQSRMACFRRCRREHQYRYELGIRPAGDTMPLRMGSSIHNAIDMRARWHPESNAIESIDLHYAKLIEEANSEQYAEDLRVECETCKALMDGYCVAWHQDWQTPAEDTNGLTPVECIASELPFEMPIRNPETGKATTSFIASGKIDRIVRLADGRLAVKETKTTGMDTSPGSDYWLKLGIDQQISLYMLAAQHLGHKVETVLYDVIRKPSIAPKQIPLIDSDGVKIVHDREGNRVRSKDGKKWRESGSTEDGYTLQTRTEDAREFGARLRADIATRPSFYYARQEIPRLSADLDECRAELWQQQQDIRGAQKSGHWYRNSAQCSAMGRCQYLGICHSGFTGDNIPAGFVRVDDLHPELKEGV